MNRVLVVGDVVLDVVVRPTDVVAPTSDTPALVSVARGGAAANLAVALGRHGVAVTFVGACGDDDAATVFEGALTRSRVTPRLERHPGTTGTVVALIDPSTGQRAMLTDRGVNGQLTTSFVRTVMDEGFDHVHVSGYTLLDPATRDVGIAVLRAARTKGWGTSVDVCSVDPLRKVGCDLFRAAAEHATMLFANAEEALALTGAADVDDALADLGETFTEVVVTLGPDGAYAQRGDETVHAASAATRVIDTTGAGDATTGTYLGQRLAGEGLAASLERAMAAAAVVVAGGGSEGQARW